MTVRSARWTGLALVLLVVLGGQVLGQPVLVSYVASDSMAPTIEPGDGFVTVPAAVAGSVEEGDIVTFDARSLEGGGLTTHRIVDETEHGYVTKGDANPFTDQDGAEPPVTDGQIVAKAVTVDGEILVIPSLGTATARIRTAIDAGQKRLAGVLGTSEVFGAREIGATAFVLGLCILVLSARADRDRRARAPTARGTGLGPTSTTSRRS